MRHDARMDYVFQGMGPRNFEHIVQALAMAVIGPRVSVFGDGPDGGREASWSGIVESLDESATWEGYGVLQAKLKTDESASPAQNLTWLKAQVSDEIKRWSESAGRKNSPDYLLVVTNVRLSPGSGGGKDSIATFFRATLKKHQVALRGFRVWDYDDLRGLLDVHADVRKTYRAWITPGDVLSELLDERLNESHTFREALRLHAARSLKDDHFLNLRQAGSLSDEATAMAEVFVDPPIDSPARGGAVSEVTRWSNRVRDSRSGSRGIVLVGGPGQGKSTATQFLAQLYRAAFLGEAPVTESTELRSKLELLEERRAALGIAVPVARRWPIRIRLSDLADSLASSQVETLVEYLAQTVSDRSNRPVTQEELVRWLHEYPWLLIVDGLDEVPNSGNRHDVMRALADFHLEVDEARADVVVVATTRPQGYSDEFDPGYYLHQRLAELKPDEALAYAKGLIDVRHGEGSDSARRTLKSLERASKDVSTERLFSSPLQVSILSILIETLGDVPRTRWRLFSSYYRVISQREREKGGELSDLIREYESDINFIHREAGFQLQRRSGEAGDASSSLTKAELQSLIAERLENQGHAPEEVARLSTEFLRLATDRLVFLAMLTSEKVGFEIRSLQEFMAGEYLVEFPESVVISKLADLAPSAHWRNTLLFAIGRIYAEKEHLKAEITVLCHDMHENPVGARVQAGADLALDVLLEGAIDSQPRYARALADIAAGAVTGPVNERVRELRLVRSLPAREILMSASSSLAQAPSSTWVNRLLAVAEDPTIDDNVIAELLRLAPTSASRAVIRLAWDSGLTRVLDLVDPNEQPIHPEDLLNGPSTFAMSRPITKSNDKGSAMDAWHATLRAVAVDPDDEMQASINWVLDDEDLPLAMEWKSISSSDIAQWQAVRRIAFGGRGWDVLRAVAALIESPSTESLATVLEVLQTCDSSQHRMARRSWWIVKSCVDNAYSGEARQGDSARVGIASNFGTMARAARDGALGTEVDWLAAEARWAESSIRVPDSPIAPPLGDSSSTAPLWPGLASFGVPIEGMGYRITLPEDLEDSKRIARVAIRFSELAAKATGAEQATYAMLAEFVLGILGNRVRNTDETERESTYRVGEPAAGVVARNVSGATACGLGYGWVRVLDALTPDRRSDVIPIDYLVRLGSLPLIFSDPSDEIAEWLLAIATHVPTEQRWAISRLVILSSARVAIQQSATLTQFVRGAIGSAHSERVAAFLNILNASQEQLSDGVVDESFRSVFAGGESGTEVDSVNPSLLRRYLNEASDEAWVAGCALRAISLLDHDPLAQAAFARDVRQRSQR